MTMLLPTIEGRRMTLSWYSTATGLPPPCAFKGPPFPERSWKFRLDHTKWVHLIIDQNIWNSLWDYWLTPTWQVVWLVGLGHGNKAPVGLKCPPVDSQLLPETAFVWTTIKPRNQWDVEINDILVSDLALLTMKQIILPRLQALDINGDQNAEVRAGRYEKGTTGNTADPTNLSFSLYAGLGG